MSTSPITAASLLEQSEAATQSQAVQRDEVADWDTRFARDQRQVLDCIDALWALQENPPTDAATAALFETLLAAGRKIRERGWGTIVATHAESCARNQQFSEGMGWAVLNEASAEHANVHCLTATLHDVVNSREVAWQHVRNGFVHEIGQWCLTHRPHAPECQPIPADDSSASESIPPERLVNSAADGVTRPGDGDDGPFKPFGFRWKGDEGRFPKDNRRSYNFAVAAWTFFHLKPEVHMDEVNSEYDKAGGSHLTEKAMENAARVMMNQLGVWFPSFPWRFAKIAPNYFQWIERAVTTDLDPQGRE